MGKIGALSRISGVFFNVCRLSQPVILTRIKQHRFIQWQRFFFNDGYPCDDFSSALMAGVLIYGSSLLINGKNLPLFKMN